jgi:hypothetical protein
MTTDEKLAAILAAVQTDPGNRGLARDPRDNLFTATAGDFQAACRSIAESIPAALHIVTGFIIPSVDPPTFETDGPLGAVFLIRQLVELNGISVLCSTDPGCGPALRAGLDAGGIMPERVLHVLGEPDPGHTLMKAEHTTHVLAIERPGSAANGRLHTMRGRDITDSMQPADHLFGRRSADEQRITIGIGDGGNEIGMGKIPHETIVKNIPNGDRVHCRVPTDHLIVCGVSNWGAYALIAGIHVLHRVTPAAVGFDPDEERRILEVMVREGPLVDGVTGKQTATVDGVTWDEYVKPLIRIREILES